MPDVATSLQVPDDTYCSSSSGYRDSCAARKPLRRTPPGRFPVFMTSLLSVGEESGKLDEALAEVGSSYERDTDEAVSTSTSLLEPVMILLIGSIVGFVVMAMLLPIFEMDVIGGM